MTIQQAKQKLLDWTIPQVGTTEGDNNWNIYAEDQRLQKLYGWNPQNQPWCDVFTDAAFISVFGLDLGAAMTYQPIGGGSATCRISAQFFKNNNAFKTIPELCDIIFFYYNGEINHQGIVVRIDNGIVYTVEGNSGDKVSMHQYVHTMGNAKIDGSIAGYGRPRWELVANTFDENVRKEVTGMNGVDISIYQKGLTIQQLKDAGKYFAILKLTESTNIKDEAAFTFYKEAYELNFPTGGYCYSHALTLEQGLAEGNYAVKMLNGFPMPLGIYIDIERDDQLSLPKEKLLNVIRGFCAAVGGAGYLYGVYSSEGTLWSKISPDDLPSGTLVWIAKWSDAQPSVRCDLWQNSDSGTIDGYSGSVDTDVAMSELMERLIDRGYHYASKDQSDEEYDPTPISEDVDPNVMTLQVLLSYNHLWGQPDGKKSPEFFTALRKFIDILEN